MIINNFGSFIWNNDILCSSNIIYNKENEILNDNQVNNNHNNFYDFFNFYISLIASKISEKVPSSFSKIKANYFDKNNIIKSNSPIKTEEKAYWINQAILNDSRDCNNPQISKKIPFLTANHLGKVAPTHPFLQYIFPGLENFYQTQPIKAQSIKNFNWYHRFKPAVLVAKEDAPIIPMDTTDLEEFISLKFTLIKDEDKGDIKNEIKETLRSHISSFDSLEKSLEKNLKKPIIIDLTGSNSEPNATKAIIEEAAQELGSTDQEKKLLLQFVRKNVTCIERIDAKPPGIKILPIFFRLKGKKVKDVHPDLMNFLAETGLVIGAVNQRRYLSSPEEEKVKLLLEGKKEVIYFKNVDEFLSLSLLGRLSKADLMSKATVQLLQGLLKNINNKQLFTSEFVQTTLFRIQMHLANAELYAKSDFIKYSKEIELTHYLIAALLEVAEPFKDADFEKIYRKNLSGIPKELQPFIKAGIGKTAMNLFAGISVSLLKSNPNPVYTYTKGSYFETATFIGNDKDLETTLADPNIEKVDLITCDFNHNIDIDEERTHYEVTNVGDTIRKIFKQKPKTEHLTVAIDCTIDYINSEKVNKLVRDFSKEIQEGKINFIFFRSGQKFDMFGIDNYYGAPFFMLNNGASHWKDFDAIRTNKACKPDGLSYQWFCLANQFVPKLLDEYREAIFKNTREILNHIPERLLPRKEELDSQKVWVSTCDKNMDAPFLDIKIKGKWHLLKSLVISMKLFLKCQREGVPISFKGSFGFPNLNVIAISEKTSTSIRINPGINSKENNVLIDFFKELNV